MVIEFNLGSPSFTLLHSAGVAGLWMTLNQLEQENVKPENIDWKLERRKVTLSWQGRDLDVLNWLLQQSFQIHKGMIAFKGLDSKTMLLSSQLIMHEGVLGTFLQHPSTYESDGVEKKSFEIEEGKPEWVVQHKVIKSYAHQEFAKKLCDQRGNLLKTPIRVAGWLNPGAVVRHIAFSTQTSFEESPENALVLLFAPVACYYFRLKSHLKEKKALYALIIPEVTDLKDFAQNRQQSKLRSVGYKDFFASGLGDAGLKFLTYETTAETASTYNVQRCQVITLGTVAWSEQQKTRTEICLVEANAKVCQNYKIAQEELSDRYFVGENGGFIQGSFARELIADNLATFQPWYSGISTKINNDKLFQKLTYERGGLYRMVQRTEWNSESERLFVEACHEALGAIYGQVKEQAVNNADKHSSSDEFKKDAIRASFQREAIRIRSSLSRCKNAETFREFITKFWAKAGRVPTLKQHWQTLMDLVMGRGDWKKARDLTLLALASYKGKGKVEDANSLEDDIERDEDDLPDI